MSLHAIQGRDSKVVGINVEMVISVRGTPQEIASECKGDSIEEGSTFWSGIVPMCSGEFGGCTVFCDHEH